MEEEPRVAVSYQLKKKSQCPHYQSAFLRN
jgi:hypothetical protein